MSFWDRLTESEQQDCADKNAAHKIARKKGNSPCGVVRQKWTTEIYPAIKDIMNDPGNRARIYGTSSKHPICSFRLFMLYNSPTWKPARPTIVVLCIDRKFAKRTVDLLEKMPILKKSVLGFDFLISEEEIRLAADHSETTSPVAQRINLSLCGVQVVISPSQMNQPWTRATIGGVIVINGRFYGLTAAHAFSLVQESTKSEFSDVVSSNGTASTISNGDDQNPDHNTIPPGAQALTWPNENGLEAEIIQMEGRSIYLDERSSLAHRSSIDNDGAIQKPANVRAENLIGTIEASANLHELPSSQFNIEHDWALVEILASRFHTPNTVETPTGEILRSINVSPAEPNGHVLVAAGVSGVFQTECSGLLSGIILPDSTKMLDAWTISESSLPGDCGAWVLDRQNGDVFGMIVATSYNSQESYCLPISTIFDSILASRPNGTTISFPDAASQAYGIPPGYYSHSSSGHIDSEEAAGTHLVAQESTDPDPQTSLSEIGDHKSAFEPTAVSEKSPSDASHQSPSKVPREPDALQAREDAVSAYGLEPIAGTNAKHSQPVQSRWARAETCEFPTAALDSLGVPWRKAEGVQTQIMVDREVIMILRKMRAQEQSANTEAQSSNSNRTLTEDLDTKARRADVDSATKSPPPFKINLSPPHSPQAVSQSQPEIVINKEPAITSEAELAAEPGPSIREDDAESDKTDDSDKRDKTIDFHLVGDDFVKVTHRTFPGKTMMPAALVEDRILYAYNYDFYVQDGMYYIAQALDKDSIDDIVERSKHYRFSQGGPMDKQSGSRIFERSSGPAQSPHQVASQKYDLQFEEEIRKTLSQSNLEGLFARTLNATALELIQKFRENRSMLAEAFFFLHNYQQGGAVLNTRGHSGKMERLESAVASVTVGEEAIHRKWSPPPRRLPSPETIISRTTHDLPHGREEIFTRKRSPHGPLPRRTDTGLTDDSYFSPRRERSEERIEIRRTEERGGNAYDEDVIVEVSHEPRYVRVDYKPDDRRDNPGHNSKTRTEAQSAVPEASTVNVTTPGQERDRQEEAEYYNNRMVERSFVGEAKNGATRDWAVLDVPPGTKKVVIDGTGGGTLEVTWQLFNGVRRSKFCPDVIGNAENVRGDVSPKAVEGTSKAEPTTTEPNRVERQHNKDESPSHRRHPAEGVLADMETAELLRHHRNVRGRGTSGTLGRIEKNVGSRGHAQDREELKVDRDLKDTMTRQSGALPTAYFPEEIRRQKERGREQRARGIERDKAVRFERPRESRMYRSSQQPFMKSYMRVNRQYVSPEALDHYRLAWQYDRDDSDFILIKEDVSDDLQQRLFKYTEDLNGQKLIKNLAEFRDDDLDNLIKEARARKRKPERPPPHREPEKIIYPRYNTFEREEEVIRRDDYREDDQISIVGRDDRDDTEASRISEPRYDDYELSRPRSFERERIGDNDEIIIRRDEYEVRTGERPEADIIIRRQSRTPSPISSATARKRENSALIIRR